MCRSNGEAALSVSTAAKLYSVKRLEYECLRAALPPCFARCQRRHLEFVGAFSSKGMHFLSQWPAPR